MVSTEEIEEFVLDGERVDIVGLRDFVFLGAKMKTPVPVKRNFETIDD